MKVYSDNTTAIACVNKKGTSRSPPCHSVTLQIWKWAENNKIHITAAHIPGVENVVADRESRKLHRDGEWMLQSNILLKLFELFNTHPDIDLFASRVNHQLARYVSYNADPGAEEVDAFTIDWNGFTLYAFPPIAIIGQVLKKITYDQAEGVLIVPYWPNQSWYPMLFKLIVSIPIIIPSRTRLLHLPSEKDAIHPMWRKMSLLALNLSGKKEAAHNFQKKLFTSSSVRGETVQTGNISRTFKSSEYFVLKEQKIHFRQLKN